MPDDVALSRLLLTYVVESRCGCGRIDFSDGVNEASLEITCAMGHPIPYLVSALEKMLNYGSEGRCDWWWSDRGDVCRVVFRRTGDALHVRALWFCGQPSSDFSDEGGEQVFSATCDLWKFAARLRLEKSRIGTSQEESQLKSKPQKQQQKAYRIPGYKTLEEFLEESKHRAKASAQHRTRGMARR